MEILSLEMFSQQYDGQLVVWSQQGQWSIAGWRKGNVGMGEEDQAHSMGHITGAKKKNR